MSSHVPLSKNEKNFNLATKVNYYPSGTEVSKYKSFICNLVINIIFTKMNQYFVFNENVNLKRFKASLKHIFCRTFSLPLS